jgi:tetratricopeptide (TPR) repeat protein
VKLAPLLIVLGLARVAMAQAPDAERLYNDGQTAYDDKRYDDAITAWQKSYELSHLPGLVFNLAQAHRLRGADGDCAKAVEQYQTFIKLDPSSGQRPDAESRLKELQPCPVKVVVEPPPPKIVPVTHPVEQGGHGKRIASYVIGVVGLGAIGLGVYYGSQAQSLANDVRTACATGCEWTADLKAKDADGRSDETLQWIGYGVGAAAIVTSGLLFYLGREHAPPITVAARPDGAAVTWSGSW